MDAVVVGTVWCGGDGHGNVRVSVIVVVHNVGLGAGTDGSWPSCGSMKDLAVEVLIYMQSSIRLFL
jgi:hypothetical protein